MGAMKNLGMERYKKNLVLSNSVSFSKLKTNKTVCKLINTNSVALPHCEGSHSNRCNKAVQLRYMNAFLQQ